MKRLLALTNFKSIIRFCTTSEHKKSEVFWCFQGVWKWNIGLRLLNLCLQLPTSRALFNRVTVTLWMGPKPTTFRLRGSMLTTTLATPSSLDLCLLCKCCGFKYDSWQTVTLLNRLLLEFCSWVTVNKDYVTFVKYWIQLVKTCSWKIFKLANMPKFWTKSSDLSWMTKISKK